MIAAENSNLEGLPPSLRIALQAKPGARQPTNIVLLRLAIESDHAAEVAKALEQALAWAMANSPDREAVQWLASAVALWRENPQAFDLVKSVLEGVEHEGAATAGEQALIGWAETFDRLAAASPEGGVALYALGNPDLLRSATDEVVARLNEWRLLQQTGRVLEIGCGIGRFAEAVAPYVRHVVGLDISSGMIARARERCAGLSNVTLEVTSGHVLEGIGDGSVDLVLAADVFPYLVQAGPEFVERQVREAGRVLRTGAELVILNHSYRADLARDRNELEAAAERCGLFLHRVSDRDFSLWDAASFRLRKL